MANFASQRRTAFSSMAWNTGSNSPGDALITLSTSAVAVCCCSASLSSRVRACTSSNSRTFPIAITAWSAKVCSNAICLSLNGCTSVRRSAITPIHSPSRSNGTHKMLRKPSRCEFSCPSGNSSPSSDSGSRLWTVSLSVTARPVNEERLIGHLSNLSGIGP